jgi:hypothetical protein
MSEQTAPLDLEALATTVARMTEGEWQTDPTLSFDDSSLLCIFTASHRLVIAELNDDGMSEEECLNNAAGIVALKNAAPALIAETQALRERVRVLEEAFSNVQTLVTEVVDLERIACVTALDAISDIARAALSGE